MKLEQSRRKAERCAQDRAMTWTSHTNISYPEQLITKHFWYSGNYAVSLSIISLHMVVTFLDQRWWIWKQLQLVCVCGGLMLGGWTYTHISICLSLSRANSTSAFTSFPSLTSQTVPCHNIYGNSSALRSKMCSSMIHPSSKHNTWKSFWWKK
jgi:hypothetical protein